MSEVQPESPKPIDVVPQTPVTTPLVPPQNSSTTGVQGFLNGWKLKVGLAVVGLLIVVAGLFWFYYPYKIAMIGLERWSRESGAQSIDCMMRDTDNNQYISCSAKMEQKVFPLECGSSLFNMGCRVSKAELLRE